MVNFCCYTIVFCFLDLSYIYLTNKSLFRGVVERSKSHFLAVIDTLKESIFDIYAALLITFKLLRNKQNIIE